MSQALTQNQTQENPLADGLPSLPKLLRNAINEDYHPSDNPSLLEMQWKVPAVVSDELRTQATSYARSMIGALKSVENSRLKEWLVMLGTLSAGQMSVADARLKMAAYAEMLSGYPAGVFTKETLFQVSKISKWMPSFAEIAEVLDKKDCELRRVHRRCVEITSAPNNTKDEWKAPTPEEKAKVAEIVSGIIKSLSGDRAIPGEKK